MKFLCKAVGTSEWHHTSCHYNRTDHYDVAEIYEGVIRDEELAEYKEIYETK